MKCLWANVVCHKSKVGDFQFNFRSITIAKFSIGHCSVRCITCLADEKRFELNPSSKRSPCLDKLYCSSVRLCIFPFGPPRLMLIGRQEYFFANTMLNSSLTTSSASPTDSSTFHDRIARSSASKKQPLQLAQIRDWHFPANSNRCCPRIELAQSSFPTFALVHFPP